MLTTIGRVECFVPVKQLLVLMLLAASQLFAQGDGAELRIKITDPLGLGISCKVELASEPGHRSSSFITNDDGNLTLRNLSPGLYRLHIKAPGFTPVARSVELLSVAPVGLSFRLVPLTDPASDATMETELTVQGLPLTLNRSPDFGLVPQATTDDPQTWESVGIPAEAAL